MKTKYKHAIVALMIIFGLFAIVSSVSATQSMEYLANDHEIDKGNKTFEINKNKKYSVSWNAYRISKNKNGTINIHKSYFKESKIRKILWIGTIHYKIEKVKKNRIKVSITYPTYPTYGYTEVKIYKTKLSVETFYLKNIKPQFKSKFDKKILSKESIIDSSKMEVKLPHNKSCMYNHNNFCSKMNIRNVKHTLKWEAMTYTKFPKVIYIRQTYTHNHPGISWPAVMDYSKYIKLEKTENNKIKIVINKIVKTNGDPVKKRTYFVKTSLPLKKYYSNVFKPNMIKLFS